MARGFKSKGNKKRRPKSAKTSSGKGNRVRRGQKKSNPRVASRKPKRISKRKSKVSKRQISRAPKLSVDLINRNEEAEHLIGEQNIRKGSRRIGTTAILRPTKAGFRELKGIIERVTDPKDFARYSFDLRVTIRNKQGKLVKKSALNTGIPRYNPKRHKLLNKQLKKFGIKLNKKEYFEYVVFHKIRREIFGTIADIWGKYPSKKVKSKLSKKKQLDLFARVRKQDVQFTFTLNREK